MAIKVCVLYGVCICPYLILHLFCTGTMHYTLSEVCTNFCTVSTLRSHIFFLHLKIDGKGNCFFEALLIQLSFTDDPEGVENYKYHIRRQMVAHILKHLDLFRDWLRTRIREFYGTGDRDMGLSV